MSLKEVVPGRSSARLQFRVEPEIVPWIYASSMNQPQVVLYKGVFPEPFPLLTYVVQSVQKGQLALAAIFQPGPDFTNRYGSTVGSPEDLAPLIKRYSEHRFSPDGTQLILTKDKEIFGGIVRASDGTVVIQRGAPLGSVSLSEDTPVNDLTIQLDHTNLLVQRYVNAIWRGSDETDQKQMLLTLGLSSIPEGAATTFFSTYELVAKEFNARPRAIDLDEDIGGYPLFKALVRGLIMDLTQPEVSRRFGTKPHSNKFVLVTGREGTGKSLFPKALDTILRQRGTSSEYFRLPLQDILPQYGPRSVHVVETILEHVRTNERNGVPTLLHIDHLEELIPLYERANGAVRVVPDSEFSYSLQTRTPVINALRRFGGDLGAESHHVIVYGESRLPRSALPEMVARTFRRAFPIEPNTQDLAEILKVQIGLTRRFAEGTGFDPISADIDSQLPRIAAEIIGANGRDIQQALLNIATRKKGSWDGKIYTPTTAEEITREVGEILLAQGIKTTPRRKMGFV